LGLDKNTVVFFTSDNGPHKEGGADPEFFNSNGPWRGIKRDLYEGGIRVPMIAWGLKIKGGEINNEPWANWDILPTLCNIAGAEIPKDVDGISMLPALAGDKTDLSKTRSFFWQFNEGETRQAIVKNSWKLIRFKKEGAPVRMELFNLVDDPGEKNNLAMAQPQKVSELMLLMKQSQTPPEHPQFNWAASEQ
jgi:arylsulfatase A-like enzyme